MQFCIFLEKWQFCIFLLTPQKKSNCEFYFAAFEITSCNCDFFLETVVLISQNCVWRNSEFLSELFLHLTILLYLEIATLSHNSAFFLPKLWVCRNSGFFSILYIFISQLLFFPPQKLKHLQVLICNFWYDISQFWLFFWNVCTSCNCEGTWTSLYSVPFPSELWEAVLTHLSHIHQTGHMIDSHTKHLSGEVLGVFRPGDVQLIQHWTRNPELTVRSGHHTRLRTNIITDHLQTHQDWTNNNRDNTAVTSCTLHINYYVSMVCNSFVGLLTEST